MAGILLAASLNGLSLTISPNTANISKTRFGNTCYAGVRFLSTGEEQTLGPLFSWASDRGDWLDAGLSSAVWVQRTVNSGSLNQDDPGAGRLQLSTTRSYSVVQSSGAGTQSANVTFDFYDAASGGSLLDSVTLAISAEWTT